MGLDEMCSYKHTHNGAVHIEGVDFICIFEVADSILHSKNKY